MLSAVSKVTLNNGVKMPLLGLGTYQAVMDEVRLAVASALDSGYIRIDTAAIYRNEKDIGAVLKERRTKREDVFITSKIPPTSLSYDGTVESCLTTLKDLQTDYVDLMLIHWPAKAKVPRVSKEHINSRKEAWRALEDLYSQGKCKAIGVSNYTVGHLEQMKTYWKIKPAVNQVECHPYLTQEAIRKWCKENDILVEAYSSLGQGDLLRAKEVVKIAESHGVSTAQVLLRWGLQHNIAIIPKSVTPERIKTNILLYNFSLSDDEMQILNSLDRDHHYCWDPTEIP